MSPWSLTELLHAVWNHYCLFHVDLRDTQALNQHQHDYYHLSAEGTDKISGVFPNVDICGRHTEETLCRV